MPFTTPLALLGLLFIPAVVAMYLLKLRRDETIVPSTLLWTRLVADVEANAPWQKLRRSLLLLLQLLLVVILALLAARPFLERPAGLARDIVLVIDTSASMAATDVLPNRLEAAKEAAIAALRDLPTGGKVSVIAADRSARIVVNETTDLGRVRQALDGIETTSTHGDLGDALELAGKLAARSGDAQILVATDGALATPATTTVPARVTVLPVGRERKNQAIVAMAVRTAPSAVTRSVFVSVANLDLERAGRRLEVWGDGSLIEVRDLLLEPQARSDVVIDDVPRDVGTLEIRLVGPDPTVAGAPDQLAVDDHAWAIIPPDRTRLILVVGPGDPYLETALSYLPNVELFGVTAAEYGPASERKDGRPWDLVIFEGALPATLPRSPILAIAPGATSPLGEVTGTLTNPGIGSLDPDEPVLRYVDLSTTHIASAVALRAPRLGADGHPRSTGRSPALRGLAGRPADRGPGLRTAPLRPAAPGRVPDPAREPDRGAARRLCGADRGGPARDTGQPLDPGGRDRSGRHEARRIGRRARARDGAVGWHHVLGDGPAGRLHRHAAPRAVSVGRDRRGAAPAPTATASPTAPGGVRLHRQRPRSTRTRRSASRSPSSTSTNRRSRPGSAAAIEALGVGAGPSASPGPATGQGSAATTRPTARDELWVPIVLLVLIALCIEWAVYHRDALTRLRRGLGARFGRNAPDGSA